jgi:site-specific recombinase
MSGDREGLRERVEAFTTAVNQAERTDGFVELVRWVLQSGTTSETPSGTGGRAPRRLDLLLDVLDEPDQRRRVHAAIAELLTDADATGAFAHAGIPSERGFLAELGERVMNHVLPRPRNDQDLGYLLRRLFQHAADVEQLTVMPVDELAGLIHALSPAIDPDVRQSVRRSFVNGFRLLALSVQAQGLSPKLRRRSRPSELTESPFYRIMGASEAIAARWNAGLTSMSEADAWRRDCERCRGELAEVQRRLEREGVSTHVVYGVEVIERCLTRMEAMVDVMAAPDGAVPPDALRSLIVTLAVSLQQDRSVVHLIAWNTHLLQRRIVDRSGQTGEHYVTANRAEYRHMWLAAAGGGLLTVGTAAIKTALSGWHVSDFAHGVLYGLNYAVSFLLLQRLGLVLATKQPAMTAAALASIVRERRPDDRTTHFAVYAARIVRSQLAAVLGNVIVVSLGAVLFVHAWYWLVNQPFMDHAEAADVYTHFSPLSSGTVFYSALTGAILWMASVVGGWFDNFSAYHRLPRAIAAHPARRYLGRARLARWGDSLAHNGAGWATNVSLGFMLGMTPSIGHFFGVPLDVRHVTLSSGILTLAGTSLGNKWFGEGAFLLGTAGVGVMFVLNLSVSFLLAMMTAVRAYDVSAHESAELLRGLWRHFRTSPLDFFVPPKVEASKPDASKPDAVVV